MSHITLPRAVAEQVREALTCGNGESRHWCMHCDDHVPNSLGSLDILAALVAALEAQEDEALLNEPVAMRYDGDGYGYLYIDSGSGSDWQRRHKDAEPLYLAPPKPEPKPEPATDAEMSAAMTATDIPPGWWFVFQRGFRAAERHHRIKEDGK